MGNVIDDFHGDYFFLSNFYPYEIRWNQQLWPSTEHAYQAAKTNDPVLREEIRTASSPGIAKKLGRKIRMREDWKDIRVAIMLELLAIKFQRGTDLAQKLLDTGEAELVEGNTWGDTIWGVCNGVGQNLLGKLLMEVRLRLKE